MKGCSTNGSSMMTSSELRRTGEQASFPAQPGRAPLKHQRSAERGDTMSNTDDAKGRIKEAAGDLTDDKDLKREGKVDQASGKAKDKIDDVGDKAKDFVNRD